jgi:multiple sugar transport system permease protein
MKQYSQRNSLISPPATGRLTSVMRLWSRRSGGIRQGEMKLTFSILVPALIYYILLRYYPVLQTLVLSITDARLLSPTYNYVGMDNFSNLFSDPVFLQTLWNTTYYAFATTIVTTLLALIVAFLMDPIRRGVEFIRLIYFLPVVTSAIAIATIWQWLYQARFGFFNQLLSYFGLRPVPWLTSVEWAMPSLIIMSIWGSVGFSAIIFVAGLKGIPREFSEAARIDGASALQVALRIKLPLLARVISFVFLTGIVGSFQVFQQVYLMTGGGPLNATRVLALQIYQLAFNRFQLGIAAAVAVILFLVVSVLTVVQLQAQRTDWEY